MPEVEPELIYIDLCCFHQAEDVEELRSIVESLSDINAPDNLPNQSFNVDLDNLGNTEIFLSTGPRRVPTDLDQTAFIIRVNDDENWIHSHLYSEAEYIDPLTELLASVLRIQGPTIPTRFGLVHQVEPPVDELGIGSAPEGARLSGIRFYYDDHEYIFGESNSNTSIRCELKETGELTDEDLEDKIDERVKQTQSTIKQITNDNKTRQ